MVRTLDEADRPGAEFDQELMLRQTDALIMSAIQALDGRSEAEMVRHLLAVRDNLRERGGVAGRSGNVGDVKDQAMASVNDYFERRLFEVPSIKAYVDGLVAAGAGGRRALTGGIRGDGPGARACRPGRARRLGTQAGPGSGGRLNQKVVQPASETAPTRPPASSTRRRTMARPTPAPPRARSRDFSTR